MAKDNKTNEYLIRLGVVQQLLNEGWKREDIRIEIPMDTNSSGGRIDILCLSDYLGVIELKSGKDKLENDLLAEQLGQYRRAFDYCAVIADNDLYASIEKRTSYSISKSDNFRHVDLTFTFDWFSKTGKFSEEPKKNFKDVVKHVDEITPLLFPKGSYKRSGSTSVSDMAGVLWADELRAICKMPKGTKGGLGNHIRETMCVRDFRPLMIDALRKRPLNEWEKSFWDNFDGVKKETYLQQQLRHLLGS